MTGCAGKNVIFSLDQRLENDTEPLQDWPLSRVLLMKDRRFPWLILVPRRDGIREIFELGGHDRKVLMDELCRASRALTHVFSPEKINVGALGNVVPQLHVHVVARRAGDAAWPGPVWGRGPAEPYSAGEMADVTAGLLSAFKDFK